MRRITDQLNPHLYSDKYKAGDRVGWIDVVSLEVKEGELLQRTHVTGFTSMSPFDPIHHADYWDWEILGDDGHIYALEEGRFVGEAHEKTHKDS